MIIPERPALERRVLDLIAAPPGSRAGATRIAVVPGGCGTGRTSLLLRLRDLVGRNAAQYIDVERVATTPERFLKAVCESSPFPMQSALAGSGDERSPRDAFAAALRFLSEARGSTGDPVMFLLDEFLELRTFESFPGLRSVLRDFLAALQASPNRFVLTTRYTVRAHRLLRDAPSRFEVVAVAPLSPAEVRATLPPMERRRTEEEEDHTRDELARLVQALADGRPAYARLIAETAVAMAPRGGADPVGALSALLAPGGQLTTLLRFCYELRLHRARGYGALKAILEVLAAEEPLTLTEIALRLRRTPGSTKDYLSWLEDVDLIDARQKRYRVADPLMRVWIRLHCRAVPPAEEEVAHEVHTYVLGRLPDVSAAPLALTAAVPGGGTERDWGIIEID